jgi:hypothetical protein
MRSGQGVKICEGHTSKRGLTLHRCETPPRDAPNIRDDVAVTFESAGRSAVLSELLPTAIKGKQDVFHFLAGAIFSEPLGCRMMHRRETVVPPFP